MCDFKGTDDKSTRECVTQAKQYIFCRKRTGTTVTFCVCVHFTPRAAAAAAAAAPQRGARRRLAQQPINNAAVSIVSLLLTLPLRRWPPGLGETQSYQVSVQRPPRRRRAAAA